ncbi:diaminopimelate epimerase [Gracilimonas tropica]|uniref:diaminopimelate epimerase n=1 Tax=Gracilimonas tropica TaxID=454600 RepID=UPI001FE23348|nr:diaminopimelate epimerase [Gracilimonas tropica]
MMTELRFHKMQGAGNDFIVIDNRKYAFSLDQIIRFTPKLCDRKFGIGADGILVLQQPQRDDVDFTMIYRNADGSDAGMCGNGARCLVQYAHEIGFNATQTFNVHDNVYEAEVHPDGLVSIHFPVHVIPEKKVLEGRTFIKADAATEHLVTFFDKKPELENEEHLVQLGSSIRYHKTVDPPGSNVNFVFPENESSIQLQTYERGVEDLTLACGTGALASAIATHFHQGASTQHASYSVHVKGGTLKASFDFNADTNTYHQLILTGPAHFVFEGTISI